MKKVIAVCLMLVCAVAVFADQSVYITKAEAVKAVALFKTKKQIKYFCAPCGDKSTQTEDIQTVEMVEDTEIDNDSILKNNWKVKINGEEVDLAYIYFKTTNGKWKNVAKELKIVVSGVPIFLPKSLK